MKRYIALCAALCCLFTTGVSAASYQAVDINIGYQETAAHSESCAYNWYCKHTKDHSQPPLDSLFNFTKNSQTYYIDKNNSDYEAKEKVIYLTFDVGYENGNVAKILDILKEKEVTGAFFVLEHVVQKNTDLIQRMADEGHLICNHTASHHDMSAVNNKEEFAAELEALEKVCKDVANVDVAKYYRPPEGRFSEQNLIWANELGYKTVLWSYGYMDWDNNAQPSTQASYDKVLSGTHNGEVLLLHPTSATNAAILGDLIDAWKDEGFRFGTLDELCK
ncbi:MAG: polysaccharide deacetylase family protein [Clostridiales bacterium]|jgi:peptidoglycan-N-acetylmuramic acid deacetylase|nr:polysaccharide deacetylase family protein [Clostridiales bacterium]